MNIQSKKIFYLQKKKLSTSLTGFTMIELLIALAVFMVGIMAAFSLSLQNLNSTKENANRVIAADLAREGIETVRNIRDSNWLAREANVVDISGEVITWHEDLDAVKAFSTVNYNNNLLIALSPQPANLDMAISNPSTKLYIKDGFYKHDDTGTPTVFRRAIEFRAICLNIASKAETESDTSTFACPGAIKIGFQVTSRVSYTYGSRTNTIDSVEKIYNWRQ